MDVVKERLQIEGQVSTVENFGGSMSAFRNIIKHEGVAGLYRAYWMHQFTWAPYNGLYFAVYEALKKYAIENSFSVSTALGFTRRVSSGGSSSSSSSQGISALDKFLCAIGAATIASTTTSPIDLVKTRLQVQASNPTIFDYNGPLDATIKIFKREGFLGLFDGLGARIMWLAPRISITVSIYEACSVVIKEKLK